MKISNLKETEPSSYIETVKSPLDSMNFCIRILVTDLQIEKSLFVNSDLHIGGLMLRLVNEIDIAMDWSDHSLWWPARNVWLKNTRWSLDSFDISPDTLLHFTPMHKILRIQLPDLNYIEKIVDFSVPTFNSVISLCKELEIRYPEELSFSKPLDVEHLKFNYSEQVIVEKANRKTTLGKTSVVDSGTFRRSVLEVDRLDTNSFIANSDNICAGGTLRKSSRWKSTTLAKSSNRQQSNSGSFLSLRRNKRRSGSYNTMNGTLQNNGHLNGSSNSAMITPYYLSSCSIPNENGGNLNGNVHGSHNGYNNGNGTFSTIGSVQSLSISRRQQSNEDDVRQKIVRPKNLKERARMNVAWLDSSLSIMEQGVRDMDTLLLRFKFHTFYDVDANLDATRINLIYEQAKWEIHNEEIDCTEEEMVLFASLQMQVEQQNGVIQSSPGNVDEADNDIERALYELQIALEGQETKSNGRFSYIDNFVPQNLLKDYFRYKRSRKWKTLNGFRRGYFVLNNQLQLRCYSSKEFFGRPVSSIGESSASSSSASSASSTTFVVNIKGCEITQEVNLNRNSFLIRLAVPSADGMSNLKLKCESEEQFVRWMAAFRLGARGLTLTDPNHQSEIRLIRSQLDKPRIQQQTRHTESPSSTGSINEGSTVNKINLNELLAPRFRRKSKVKMRQKITQAYLNVRDLDLLTAKMSFIRSWQSLPDFGVSLFVVRFQGERKEELLGISSNRIMRMCLQTGEPIKTWRFNVIKAWNINWETKIIQINLGDDRKDPVIFQSLSAECKVVHEFIGGYIFLSMRGKEKNQKLDIERFHKLTGGWT